MTFPYIISNTINIYNTQFIFALRRYNLTLAHGVKLSIVQRCHTCSVYSYLVNIRWCWYFMYMLHIIYNTWLHVCPRAFVCCSYIYEYCTLVDFHGMKTQQRVCFTSTMTRVQRLISPAHPRPLPRAIMIHDCEVPIPTHTHIYILYSCEDRFVTSRIRNSRNITFLCARDSFTYRTNVNTITSVAHFRANVIIW